MLDVPVALIIFRRPDLTRKVLQAISQVKPRKLLVIADGPDPNRPGEAEKCAQARAVIDAVDWDCQVLKRYSDVNLGVEAGISSGLDWVFDQCPQAIVLEDDDLPDPSFFSFCAEMLERYGDDERVSVINGTNLQLGRSLTSDSYYFSRYFHCWGFATWRRFWRHYDVKIQRWNQLRKTNWLSGICQNSAEARYFADKFDRVAAGQLPTWDYQITFAMWAAGGLAITPNVNLVSNLGHGPQGLYCKDPAMPFAALPLTPLEFPLRHPPLVARDSAADDSEFANNMEPVLRRQFPTPAQRLRRAVGSLLPAGIKALWRR